MAALPQDAPPFNQRLYNVPRGRVGKDVVNEVATITDDVPARKCNMEKLMLFFPVILQEVAGVVGLADKKKHIASRLAMWRAAKFKGLVEATLHSLKASQAKSRGDTTPEHRARVFDSKVKRGQLSTAVSYIADREGSSVFYPGDIDEKSGEPVGKVLRSKHPPLRDPGVEALHAFEAVPEFIDISITAEIVKLVAGKLSGSAGLIGFDSAALRELLLTHGQSSRRL